MVLAAAEALQGGHEYVELVLQCSRLQESSTYRNENRYAKLPQRMQALGLRYSNRRGNDIVLNCAYCATERMMPLTMLSLA